MLSRHCSVSVVALLGIFLLTAGVLHSGDDFPRSAGNFFLEDALKNLRNGNISRAIDEARGVFETSEVDELMASAISWPYEKRPDTVRTAADLLLREIDVNWRRFVVEGVAEGEVALRVRLDLIGALDEQGQVRVMDTCFLEPGASKGYRLSLAREEYTGFPLAIRVQNAGATEFYEVRRSEEREDSHTHSIFGSLQHSIKVRPVVKLNVVISAAPWNDSSITEVSIKGGENLMEWKGVVPQQHVLATFPGQFAIALPTPATYRIVLSSLNRSIEYGVFLEQKQSKTITLPPPGVSMLASVRLPGRDHQNFKLFLTGLQHSIHVEEEIDAGPSFKEVAPLPSGSYVMTLDAKVELTSIRMAAYCEIPDGSDNSAFRRMILVPELRKVSGQILTGEHETVGGNLRFFSPNIHLQTTDQVSDRPMKSLEDDWMASFSSPVDPTGDFEAWVPAGTWLVDFSDRNSSYQVISESLSIDDAEINNLLLTPHSPENHLIKVHVTDQRTRKSVDGAKVKVSCPGDGFLVTSIGIAAMDSEEKTTENGMSQFRRWSARQGCSLLVSREGYINSDLRAFDLNSDMDIEIALQRGVNRVAIRVLSEKGTALSGYDEYLMVCLLAGSNAVELDSIHVNQDGTAVLQGLGPGTYLFYYGDFLVTDGNSLAIDQGQSQITHTLKVRPREY